MLAFDSADVVAADRARTVVAVLGAGAVRCVVTPMGADAPIRARWWRLPLPPTAGVSRYEGSALRWTRRALDVTARPSDLLTFAVPGAPGSTLRQHDRWSPVRTGELAVIDAASPFDFRCGDGALCVVHVSRRVLGISTARARASARRLRSSPLHDLARDHVRALGALAASDAHRTVPDVGRGTVLLFGALLLSCDDSDGSDR